MVRVFTYKRKPNNYFDPRVGLATATYELVTFASILACSRNNLPPHF